MLELVDNSHALRNAAIELLQNYRALSEDECGLDFALEAGVMVGHCSEFEKC